MKVIKILHLYPDLLNLYGDKGNIECMRSRLKWRGIEPQIISCTSKEDRFDISDVDIIFMGGGSDREQKVVCDNLLKHQKEIKQYVEDGGVMVAVCGGYQLLGKYYKIGDEKIKTLEILDIYTETGKKRLIGDIILKSNIVSEPIVGFENHGGRTYIGSHTPLGEVVIGYGNTEKKDYEGVIYKNVVATYLHGPLFPKNPELCDHVLTAALKKKYSDFKKLSPLSDELEEKANKYINERFKK